ncbi:aspartic proteinase nepenthesin-1-like [Triticum dicoccoides]|uniref:aspartic proteinase nepenthesin-1-like n=1 Tax=Triticum dicoccoides TaxID=85692 RepID=UPI0018910674|nr:aspartic proteinase nepenthesin-1-like [Triticum dicoccoides]
MASLADWLYASTFRLKFARASQKFWLRPFLTLLALLAWPATSRSATLQLHAHLTHVDSGRGFTQGELLGRMVARSRARAAKLCPSGPGGAVTVPAVSSSGVIGSTEYLIHLGIGTPRPQHVALEVDTGSNVIWTQCTPCFKCFDQRFPKFNTSASDTVHGVACSNQLCQGLQRSSRACFLGGCAYRLVYGDKSVSMGQLAKDSFTFQQGKVVPDLAFGCGQYTTGNFSSNESGFARGPLSLPGPLRVGSFSYCFTSIFESRSSPVFLGAPDDDLTAHATGPVLSTPFVRVPDSDVYYYLSLKGITVGKVRLPVPESAFTLKTDGSGGTIIDSGTAITSFPRAVFRILREAFVSQVALPHMPYDDDGGPGELQCFQTDSVPDASKVAVPKLILHLEGGADWELPRENYMAKHPNLDDQLCVVIDSAGDDLPTIIGNFQQQNMHIVYDLAGNKLLIVPAQCHNM